MQLPLLGDGAFFRAVQAQVLEQTNGAQRPQLCASFELPRDAVLFDPASWGAF